MKENKDRFLVELWRNLHSMKLGIILLMIIGLLSIIGTVIPQENPLKYYETNYSQIVYEIIKAFSLYKVYDSWWFIALISVLALNLILCSIKRFKQVFNLVTNKIDFDLELNKLKDIQKISLEKDEIGKIFNEMKYKSIKEKDFENGKLYYGDKNSIGYLGSWLTHFGILVIIVFFTYGKLYGFEAYVHGVPGTTVEVPGTQHFINIKDFNVSFRDDFTVEQYVSDIEVLKNGHVIDMGQVLVNHPFRTNDLNVYQNSTGWAIDATLYKNGEEYRHKTIYQGDFFIEDDQMIALQFVNFYPDLDETTTTTLRNKSPLPNHPVMLYALFYNGHRVDMNLLHMNEEVGFQEYSFIVDNPQMFTLLQIVYDPGVAGAFVGGAFLLIGIFLAFYVNPKKLRIYVDNSGQVMIYGKSYKHNGEYLEELNKVIDTIRRN